MPRSLRQEAFSSGHRLCSRMRAAGARERLGDGRLQWGHWSLSPASVGEGATKLHLLLELCRPHHQICKRPLCSRRFDSLPCAYGHVYGRSEVMSRAHSLVGTWCKDTLRPAGRNIGQDAPGVAGCLAVQLLNLAGTNLHQFYGCV